MKKNLFVLLGLVLLSTPLAVTAVQYGDFTYSTDGSAITITGYTGTGGAVAIPNTINGLPVTSIGVSAFYNCTSLTSVTIPGSVISIRDYVFKDCTSLTSVTIPSSVTSIGVYAFGYCTSLTSVTIPDSVTSISDTAGPFLRS